MTHWRPSRFDDSERVRATAFQGRVRGGRVACTLTALVVALTLFGTTLAAQPAADNPGPDQPAANPGEDTDGESNDDGEDEDLLERYLREHDVYRGEDFYNSLMSGRTAFARGDYEAAASSFDTAATLSTDHPVAAFFGAHAKIALGEYDDAFDEIRRGLTMFPEWIEGYFELAVEYGANQHADAASRLESHLAALDLSARSAADSGLRNKQMRLLFLRGYLLWHIDRLDEAVVVLRETYALNNHDAFLTQYLDIAESWGVGPEEAPPPTEFTIPKEAEWLRSGLTQLHDGDAKRAAVHFGSEAMRNYLSSIRYEMYAWMTVALIADEQYEHAGRILKRALAIGASGAGAIAIAGLPPLADVLGETVAAEACDTLEPVPPDAPAWHALLAAFCVLLNGSPDNARTYAGWIDRINAPDADTDAAAWKRAAEGLLDAIDRRAEEPPRITDWDALLADPEEADTGNGDELDPPVDPWPAIRAQFQAAENEFREAAYGSALSKWIDAATRALDADDRYFEDSSNVLAYYWQAKILLALEEYERCRAALTRYLGVASESILRQIGLFQVGFQGEDTGDRTSEFDRVIRVLGDQVEQVPTDLDAQFVYGYATFSAGDYQSALNAFLVVAQQDPRDFLAAFYATMLQQPPYNMRPPSIEERAAELREHAQEALDEDDPATALQHFEQAYGLEGDDAALTGLIVSAWLLEDYTRAHHALQHHLLELEVRLSNPWHDFWLDFRRSLPPQRDYETLLEDLDAYLEVRSVNHHARYLQAFALYFDGRWATAQRWFEQYKMVAPADEYTKEVDYFLEAAKEKAGG